MPKKTFSEDTYPFHPIPTSNHPLPVISSAEATENPDHVRHPEGRVLHEAEAEEEGRRRDGHRGHAKR